jgi:hypothetical protein
LVDISRLDRPADGTSSRKERVMSRLRRMLTWRVGNEASDVWLQRWLCFAAAPTVLVLAGLALSKLTTTAGEAVTGFLAASAVAVSFVILGIVIPLAQRKPTEPAGAPDATGR